ncbi:MAG: hypothetical protein ACI8RD_011470 [Bacillariaceae sp.]|jgi:hypothetical protein
MYTNTNKNTVKVATTAALLLCVLATTIDGFSTSSPLSTSTAAAATTTTTIKKTMNRNPLYSSIVAEPDTATTITVEKVVEEEQESKKAASFLDDGFVFGLEGSGLDRPKGKVSQLVVEGDTLKTTDQQRVIVWSTLLGHLSIASYSILGILQNTEVATGAGFDGSDAAPLAIGLTVLQAMSITLTSWALADFGSGVLHWSVDNYGNGRTPIMGGIIAAFQGHHSAPWTITEREFENNVSKLCVPFGIQTVLALKFVFGLGPYSTLFWTIFCLMEILSQEFHKMSHTTKSEAGPIWNSLQDNGLSIGRKQHAQHHIAPYDGNYCIVSGVCNEKVDESGIFRRMEHIIYKINGIESNAWKLDPQLRERTLNGEYGLPTNSHRTAFKAAKASKTKVMKAAQNQNKE